jgi:hypothetical protein
MNLTSRLLTCSVCCQLIIYVVRDLSRYLTGHSVLQLLRYVIMHSVCFLFSMAQQPTMGQGLLIIEVLRLHPNTPHSVGLPWTSDQSNAATTSQHSQETNIHAPGEIRTRNPSKRAAADPQRRPCGHRDW